VLISSRLIKKGAIKVNQKTDPTGVHSRRVHQKSQIHLLSHPHILATSKTVAYYLPHDSVQSQIEERMQTSKSHFIRNTMITGLLILIPLFVTYVLVAFLFNLLSSAGAPIINAVLSLFDMKQLEWLSPLVPLINLILSLVLIFFMGLFGTNIVGRRILQAFHALVMRLPLVRSIYGAVKQMVETFQGPDRSFQRVVMLEYPRKGLWMMGLVAAERQNTLDVSQSDTLLSVFIPTTPNPTSGFLVLIPDTEVIETNYTVEEAFKFIVSSGIVGKHVDTSVARNTAGPAALAVAGDNPKYSPMQK